MSISDIWAILGIEPTKDQGLIREAYLAALPKHNPEDDPEGFMKLRAAYESAISEARSDLAGGPDQQNPFSGGAAQGSEDEDSLAIKEILSDFQRRLDENEWKVRNIFKDVSVSTVKSHTSGKNYYTDIMLYKLNAF